MPLQPAGAPRDPHPAPSMRRRAARARIPRPGIPFLRATRPLLPHIPNRNRAPGRADRAAYRKALRRALPGTADTRRPLASARCRRQPAPPLSPAAIRRAPRRPHNPLPQPGSCSSRHPVRRDPPRTRYRRAAARQPAGPASVVPLHATPTAWPAPGRTPGMRPASPRPASASPVWRKPCGGPSGTSGLSGPSGTSGAAPACRPVCTEYLSACFLQPSGIYTRAEGSRDSNGAAFLAEKAAGPLSRGAVSAIHHGSLSHCQPARFAAYFIQCVPIRFPRSC